MKIGKGCTEVRLKRRIDELVKVNIESDFMFIAVQVVGMPSIDVFHLRSPDKRGRPEYVALHDGSLHVFPTPPSTSQSPPQAADALRPYRAQRWPISAHSRPSANHQPNRQPGLVC